MKLTVITHTRYERPELLARCERSVGEALPAGAEHKIIECKTYDDWVKARLQACLDHELVAFVDDDDYVAKDAFERCLKGFDLPVGAVCSDEVEVNLDGSVISRSFGVKTYEAATMHPRVIHHICLLKGQLVDPRVVELHKRFGVGIDWFIRQSVVNLHGCAHVPMDGHFWTQHPGQHTATTRALYGQQIREMGRAIRETWPLRHGGRLSVVQS